MIHDVENCVDRDFVWELCKRGHVHLLSTQVTVMGETIALKGLKIPDGVELEYAYAMTENVGGKRFISLTFDFSQRDRD